MPHLSRTEVAGTRLTPAEHLLLRERALTLGRTIAGHLRVLVVNDALKALGERDGGNPATAGRQPREDASESAEAPR